MKCNIRHRYEEYCQNLLEHIFREPRIHVLYLDILIWHKVPFPPFSCPSPWTQEGKQKVLPSASLRRPPSLMQTVWVASSKDTELQCWARFLSVSVFHFPKALFGSCSDTHFSVRRQSTFASLYFLSVKWDWEKDPQGSTLVRIPQNTSERWIIVLGKSRESVNFFLLKKNVVFF